MNREQREAQKIIDAEDKRRRDGDKLAAEADVRELLKAQGFWTSASPARQSPARWYRVGAARAPRAAKVSVAELAYLVLQASAILGHAPPPLTQVLERSRRVMRLVDGQPD
eukprot:COSAG05_NODE_95_length_19507_cov_71.031791_7_plen_111_part_00